MKNIVITGGANGIGRGISEWFLAKGARVAIIDIDEVQGKALASQYENLYFFKGDVSKKEDIHGFVSALKENMGAVSILVNNAGLSKGGLLNDLSYEDFDSVLSIGLKAPYELTRLLKEDLIKEKGHIINIASSRAFQSEPNYESYAAIKGGIVAMTHAMAITLAPHVIVNAIAPGWIRVTDYQPTVEDVEAIPSGRIGTPQDIAECVDFLCTQRFINGEVITVDGGMNKRLIYHGDHGWEYHKQ